MTGVPPAPDGDPEPSDPGVSSGSADEPAADAVAAPLSTGAPTTSPRRSGGRRPQVILDSGFWVLLWVLGAILLIVLIVLAVSQVSPGPKKGLATNRPGAIPPAVRPAPPGPSADVATYGPTQHRWALGGPPIRSRTD